MESQWTRWGSGGLVLAVLVVSACARTPDGSTADAAVVDGGGRSGTDGEPAEAGRRMDGAIGDAGITDAGGGADACVGECCDICCVPDDGSKPCMGLDEAACKAMWRHCTAVYGWPYRDDPDWYPVRDDPDGKVYIGCTTACGADAVITCVYHPDDPSTCYLVTEAWVPDGWVEAFECGPPCEE